MPSDIPGTGAGAYRILPVPSGVARAEFIEAIDEAGLAETTQADVPVFAAETTPSDPLYEGYQASYLRPIGAERAWDLSTGRSTVLVAVLDSGLDLTHPEFAGRLWQNPGEIPGNNIDDDGNGCVDDVNGCRFVNVTRERAEACGYTTSTPTGAVQDDHGNSGSSQHSHGTLVSGVLGARGDNGQGITGVAWNVRIMVVKVLDCGVPSRGGQAAGDLSNVAQGIDYARRMGASIVNISLATHGEVADLAILRSSVAAAQAAGVILVAAAGNHVPGDSDVRPGYPAAYSEEAAFPLVVAVGASDNRNGNTWAGYSNYGPAIDLAAPGNDIASTSRLNVAPATGYGISSQGTSFAAPLVSGMFALMMARNPALPAADYVAMARATATPPIPAPHGGNWAGAGVIDLGRAVERVPMSVSGVALHDWRDVPAGSEVRAVVGAEVCGMATTSSSLVSLFALVVKSAAEQQGCGAPGRVVHFQVNGLDAVMTVSWGGRNAALVVTDIEVNVVSPGPGPIVVQSLAPGWNNIGHLGPTAHPLAALASLPDTWTDVRVWDSGSNGFTGSGHFARFSKLLPPWANDLEFIATYDPAWVFLPVGASVAVLNPFPPVGRQVVLRAGWNNFVYTGASRRVADALADIAGKFTLVSRYDSAAARWDMHAPDQPRYLNDFGGLMHLGVYWVYVTEDVTLVMR